MVDSISAPLDDRCAIESCRRTKDEHRHYGHAFVAASQLADLKPRPRDPFLNIRKMNDEERLGAGLPAAEGEPMVMKDEAREEPIVTAPCVFNDCGRPKTNHRGRIGHRYLAPDAPEPDTVASESNDVNDNVTSEPKSLKQMTLGILASILNVLIASYPDAIEKERVAEMAEASVTSSGFANNLGAMRSLGIIDYPSPGKVVAKPVLFLEE
jgi:hypothetical protein